MCMRGRTSHTLCGAYSRQHYSGVPDTSLKVIPPPAPTLPSLLSPPCQVYQNLLSPTSLSLSEEAVKYYPGTIEGDYTRVLLKIMQQSSSQATESEEHTQRQTHAPTHTHTRARARTCTLYLAVATLSSNVPMP